VVDFVEVFEQCGRMVAQVAESPAPIAAGMDPWFEYCERVAPNHRPIWTRLRQLDFSSDSERLTLWLLNLLNTEPPTVEINGWPTGLPDVSERLEILRPK
jgi:hypothetical protein